MPATASAAQARTLGKGSSSAFGVPPHQPAGVGMLEVEGTLLFLLLQKAAPVLAALVVSGPCSQAAEAICSLLSFASICKHLRCPLALGIGALTSSSLPLPPPTPLYFLQRHLRRAGRPCLSQLGFESLPHAPLSPGCSPGPRPQPERFPSLHSYSAPDVRGYRPTISIFLYFIGLPSSGGSARSPRPGVCALTSTRS